MTTMPLPPATLDGLIAGLVAASISLSPLSALIAILAGGAIVLMAGTDAPLADAVRQASSLALGGLGALGVAHGLAALLGPVVAGAR